MSGKAGQRRRWAFFSSLLEAEAPLALLVTADGAQKVDPAKGRPRERAGVTMRLIVSIHRIAWLATLACGAAFAQSTERASFASNGAQANGGSNLPAISADGRFVSDRGTPVSFIDDGAGLDIARVKKKAIENGDIESARKYHKSLDDPAWEISYNLALLEQNMGAFDRAATLYRGTLERNPECAEALVNLGHVLKSLGDKEAAQECWQLLTEKHPEQAKRYFGSN